MNEFRNCPSIEAKCKLAHSNEVMAWYWVWIESRRWFELCTAQDWFEWNPRMGAVASVMMKYHAVVSWLWHHHMLNSNRCYMNASNSQMTIQPQKLYGSIRTVFQTYIPIQRHKKKKTSTKKLKPTKRPNLGCVSPSCYSQLGNHFLHLRYQLSRRSPLVLGGL